MVKHTKKTLLDIKEGEMQSEREERESERVTILMVHEIQVSSNSSSQLDPVLFHTVHKS